METTILDGVIAKHLKIFRSGGAHIHIAVTCSFNGTEVVGQDDFQVGVVGGSHIQIHSEFALDHLYNFLFFLTFFRIVDKNDKVIVFHLCGFVKRNGDIGAAAGQRVDIQFDVFERSRNLYKATGDSGAIESVVMRPRRSQSQEVTRIQPQIQVKVFQLVVIDFAFHKSPITHRIGKHHILEGNGLIVDQNGRVEGIERVQIINLASAIFYRQTTLDVRLLERSSDGNLAVAKTLHPCHDARKERIEHIELQGVQLNCKIQIISLARRIIRAIHIQRFPRVIEDVNVKVNGLVFIVPQTLNKRITNMIPVQAKPLDLQVSQNHRFFLQTAHYGIT